MDRSTTQKVENEKPQQGNGIIDLNDSSDNETEENKTAPVKRYKHTTSKLHFFATLIEVLNTILYIIVFVSADSL